MKRWLLLIIAFVATATSASAHKLDLNTSLLQVHKADYACVVGELLPLHSRLGVRKVRVIEVVRGADDFSAKAGETILVGEPVIDGQAASGIYLLFLVESLNLQREPWNLVVGPYASMPTSRTDFEKDTKLDILGVKASVSSAKEALIAHAEVFPELAEGFVDKKHKAKAQELFDKRKRALLGNERLKLWRQWLSGDNELLALDALVGAYEVAEMLLPLEGGKARMIPTSERKALQDLALAGLNHKNRWARSAGLALGERVGFPDNAEEGLLRICQGQRGDDISIVWKEAHYALASIPTRSEKATDLLWANMSLEELNTRERKFVWDGFRVALTSNRAAAQEALLKRGIRDLKSKKAYTRIDAAKALNLLRLPQAYEAIYQLLQDESEIPIHRLRLALDGWNDKRLLEGNTIWRTEWMGAGAIDVYSKVFMRNAREEDYKSLKSRWQRESSMHRITYHAAISASAQILRAREQGISYDQARRIHVTSRRTRIPFEGMRKNNMVLDMEWVERFFTSLHWRKTRKLRFELEYYEKPMLDELFPQLLDPSLPRWSLPEGSKLPETDSALRYFFKYAIDPSHENAMGLFKVRPHWRNKRGHAKRILRFIIAFGRPVKGKIDLDDKESKHWKELQTLAKICLGQGDAKTWFEKADVDTLATLDIVAFDRIVRLAYKEAPYSRLADLLGKLDGAKHASAILQTTFWLNRNSGKWMGFTPDMIDDPLALKEVANRWQKAYPLVKVEDEPKKQE